MKIRLITRKFKGYSTTDFVSETVSPWYESVEELEAENHLTRTMSNFFNDVFIECESGRRSFVYKFVNEIQEGTI